MEAQLQPPEVEKIIGVDMQQVEEVKQAQWIEGDAEEKIDDEPVMSVEPVLEEKGDILKLHDVFSSYEEFEVKLNEYCAEKNQKFLRFDHKLISTANSKLDPGTKPYPDKLIYTTIAFVCGFHSDQKIRRKSERRCKALIRLSVSARSRDKLELVALNEEHNHQTIQPRARVYPMRNFARGPLPPYIYHGGGVQQSCQRIVKRKRRRTGRSVGRPSKSRLAYSDLLEEFQNDCADKEPTMPNLTTQPNNAVEQYFPPPDLSNRTENSSHQCTNTNQQQQKRQDNEVQSHNVSRTDNTLPSTLKNLSDLTEKTSSRMDADDLFFLSMASEIRHLPRSVKYNIKLQIMSVISNNAH